MSADDDPRVNPAGQPVPWSMFEPVDQRFKLLDIRDDTVVFQAEPIGFGGATLTVPRQAWIEEGEPFLLVVGFALPANPPHPNDGEPF